MELSNDASQHRQRRGVAPTAFSIHPVRTKTSRRVSCMLRAMQRGTRGKENEGSKEKQSCKIRQGKREVEEKEGKEDNGVLGR
jgi:hypothetical protein